MHTVRSGTLSITLRVWLMSQAQQYFSCSVKNERKQKKYVPHVREVGALYQVFYQECITWTGVMHELLKLILLSSAARK